MTLHKARARTLSRTRRARRRAGLLSVAQANARAHRAREAVRWLRSRPSRKWHLPGARERRP